MEVNGLNANNSNAIASYQSVRADERTTRTEGNASHNTAQAPAYEVELSQAARELQQASTVQSLEATEQAQLATQATESLEQAAINGQTPNPDETENIIG